MNDTVGKIFRGFGGHFYLCESYDPACGFWMLNLQDRTKSCVSERAIGRTYHEVYDRVYLTPLENAVEKLTLSDPLLQNAMTSKEVEDVVLSKKGIVQIDAEQQTFDGNYLSVAKIAESIIRRK